MHSRPCFRARSVRGTIEREAQSPATRYPDQVERWFFLWYAYQVLDFEISEIWAAAEHAKERLKQAAAFARAVVENIARARWGGAQLAGRRAAEHARSAGLLPVRAKRRARRDRSKQNPLCRRRSDTQDSHRAGELFQLDWIQALEGMTVRIGEQISTSFRHGRRRGHLRQASNRR